MDSQSVKEVKKALSHVVSSNVVTQSYGAVVRGACLLSAAELDSSKDYIQNNSGAWSIVYQVSTPLFWLSFLY